MKILSSVFAEGESIPSLYTCQGDDISPPLSWKDVPEGAKSLALIVDDPDAPDPLAPKILWIHWVLYNIPPHAKGLSQNIRDEELPEGTLIGTTSWERQRYGGPCPPIGEHRYFHWLYALDIVLPDLTFPTAEALRTVMKGHILKEAVLMGTYIKI